MARMQRLMSRHHTSSALAHLILSRNINIAQEGLKLTQEQEAGIIQARQDLLERLHEVAAERTSILSMVALLVLQRRPVRSRVFLSWCHWSLAALCMPDACLQDVSNTQTAALRCGISHNAGGPRSLGLRLCVAIREAQCPASADARCMGS